MKKYILTALLLLSGILSILRAEEISYDAGAKAYEAGDYKKAAQIWSRLAEESGTSADLYYDLGNAYCAEGDLGHARLYYERAYRLAPKSEPMYTNLQYVVSKVDDANKASMQGKRGSVVPEEVGFLQNIHQNVAYDHTSDYWALYAVISFILLLGAIALYLFPSNVAARKTGFFTALIFFFFSGIFLIFSFMARNAAESRDYGVITAYKVELLTEPSSGSKPSASPLNQGTKVRLLSEESDVDGNVAWYKVRLNSSYVGWLPASDVEVI